MTRQQRRKQGRQAAKLLHGSARKDDNQRWTVEVYDPTPRSLEEVAGSLRRMAEKEGRPDPFEALSDPNALVEAAAQEMARQLGAESFGVAKFP